MAKRSLKSQLSLTIAMAVFVTVALISVLSNLFISEKFKDYIAQKQTQKTQEIVSSLSQQYNAKTGQWNTDFIHTIGMYALYDGYIIKVHENNGTAVWDAAFHDMTLCTQVMADISEWMQEKYPRINGEFTSRDYPLMQSGQEVGAVTISYYGPYFLSENDFQFLKALNTILISIGSVSLLFSLILGWIMARRISMPITQTANIAKEISAGNYDIRFREETRTRELEALVTSVNDLADSLKEQQNLRKILTADIAHELRTPLTTVSTHLEAMIEGIWEPTKVRLQSCHEEINRITKLVKDLESLAEVEQNNLISHKTLINLLEIVTTISNNLEMDIFNKKLDFTVLGQVPCILADKDRISQAILNLLSNAIKYTPENGHINVVLIEKKNSVELMIEDDGIGISKADQPFIFERFYRAEKSRNRKTGGAGIGLAIVESIINAHNGQIRVESELNKGSKFIIDLPKRG